MYYKYLLDGFENLNSDSEGILIFNVKTRKRRIFKRDNIFI